VKDVRPALRAFLLDDPTVNGMVGGVRIHHSRLPQNQIEPSVVFNRVSETADYHMQGDSGLFQTRMQIDSMAQSADSANSLAGAVYDHLTGHQGTVTFDSDEMRVHAIFMANTRENYDDVSRMYRVSRDFLIWYWIY
jgi:hypothetical protein